MNDLMTINCFHQGYARKGQNNKCYDSKQDILYQLMEAMQILKLCPRTSDEI